MRRESNLALGVHERVLLAVRLLLLEPPKRRAPVRRRVLDDDLELLVLLQGVRKRDSECGTEVRVTL